MMSSNKDYSACGNRNSYNPPVPLEDTASASDMQAQNPSFYTNKVQSWRTGGSELPVSDEVESVDTDDSESVKSLKMSNDKEVSQLTDEWQEKMKVTPSNSSIRPTVDEKNPNLLTDSGKLHAESRSAVTTVKPGANQGGIGKQLGSVEGTEQKGELTKRQLKRRRQKERRAALKEAGTGLPPSSTPTEVAGKRNRSGDTSLEMDSLTASQSNNNMADVEKRKAKRRKVNKPEAEVVDPDSQKPIAGGHSESIQTQSKEQAGTSSYAKVAAKALMVTICVDKEDGVMSSGQYSHLESHIWKAIGNSKEAPKFEGMKFEGGTLVVTCSNAHSLEWLKGVVTQIPALEGCKFILTEGRRLPKLVRMSLWIPGAPGIQRDFKVHGGYAFPFYTSIIFGWQCF